MQSRRSHLVLYPEARVLGGQSREGRPVKAAPALGNRADHLVANKARGRHRGLRGIGGGQDEPDAFQPEVQRKAWRIEALLQDNLAVIFVHWRSKDAATHNVEKLRRIDAG